MLIFNNWWVWSSILSTPIKKFFWGNLFQTLQTLLIKLDINHWLIQILWRTNLISKFKSSPTRPPIHSPSSILVLEWQSRNLSPIWVLLPSLEPRLSWKPFPKALISLWLVNSVLASILPFWLLIKLQLSPSPLKKITNTDGNQLQEELSQLWKTKDQS